MRSREIEIIDKLLLEEYIINEGLRDVLAKIKEIIPNIKNKVLLQRFINNNIKKGEATLNNINNIKKSIILFLEKYVGPKSKQAVNKLEKKIKEEAKRISKYLKSNSEIIQEKINESNKSILLKIKKLAEELSEEYNLSENKSMSRAILISLCLIGIILYINTLSLPLVYAAFKMLFGILNIDVPSAVIGKLTYIVLVSFVAPITEETGKFISVHGGFTKTFFAIFNIFETFLYVTRMLNAGFSLIAAIMIRIIPIIIHGITTLIHVTAKKIDKPIIGYKIAAIIHGLYNFIVSVPVITK